LLYSFLPPAATANGAAVLVFPGGGYAGHATDYEGFAIAEWLNARGYAAWVLEYRVGPRYNHPAPLQDAQRAMRTIRHMAGDQGIDTGRIGVCGFSAGGHLASSLSTHWDRGDVENDDPIERESCRPDFSILCYPVITMQGEFMHAGSRFHLLGENPADVMIDAMSTELQVNAETPPTFIFQTNEDQSVPAENAVVYYLALRRAGVPAELHIYESGPHGVSLAQDDPILSSWPARLEDWLRLHKVNG
jgi:acetyl esterase/lipase